MDSTKHNHGTVDSGGIKIPYGKDSSEYAGSARDERISNRAGGGVDNLSHTLSGGKATTHNK